MLLNVRKLSDCLSFSFVTANTILKGIYCRIRSKTMILTSTKAWKHYMLLCRTLDRNGITYKRNDKRLCVRCTLPEGDKDHSFLFSIDPEKMLISLYSPVLTDSETSGQELAAALCVINNDLRHGCFCYCIEDRLLYFRMTTSFYETNLSGEVFEYMLSRAADTIEEYSEPLRKLSEQS